MHTPKPIDKDAILEAARETGAIVTAEEHTILGGLGSAICEVVAEIGNARVSRMGIKDNFCGVGSWICLMEQEGLTANDILNTICRMLKGRKNSARSSL